MQARNMKELQSLPALRAVIPVEKEPIGNIVAKKEKTRSRGSLPVPKLVEAEEKQKVLSWVLHERM